MEDSNASWLGKILTAAILLALIAVAYLSYQSFFGGDAPEAKSVLPATANVRCYIDENDNIIITTTAQDVEETLCPENADTSMRLPHIQLASATFQNDQLQDGQETDGAPAVKAEEAAPEAIVDRPLLEDSIITPVGSEVPAASTAVETSAPTGGSDIEKTFIIPESVLTDKYGTLAGVSYQIWLMVLGAISVVLFIWNWMTANEVKKLREENSKLQDNLRKAGSKTTQDNANTYSKSHDTGNMSLKERLNNRNSAQDETQKPVAASYGTADTSDQASDYTPYIRTPEDSARNNPSATQPDDVADDNALTSATLNDDTDHKAVNAQPVSDIAFVEKLVSEYNALGKGDWSRFGEDYGAQAFSNKRSDVSRIFSDQQARFWLIESKTEPGKAYLIPGPDTNIRWHNLRDVKSDHPLYHFFDLAPGEDLALITPTIVRKDDAQGEWLLHEKGEVSGVMAHDG
ncbi:hypothetical protein ACR9YC_00475 [Parasphingorhabdus sp. DH2-15]|uniref:hypothetical protein n=1 Tax=Parasphingorhabdus sp. DH2-15 TaxID=3444112 RepID=UPI003F6855B2